MIGTFAYSYLTLNRAGCFELQIMAVQSPNHHYLMIDYTPSSVEREKHRIYAKAVNYQVQVTVLATPVPGNPSLRSAYTSHV